MLCGTPFAGKSTLARALAARFDLVHIEIDQVHAERGVETLDDDDWLAAFQTSYRRLIRTLDAGRSVVWDATTYYRAQRDRVRKVARTHGATAVLIFVDTPSSIARSRLERNRVVRTRWDIPDDAFSSISRALEPPGADERPLRYSPEISIDDWLTSTIAPLLAEMPKELAG
jgi:predicted kinase